MPAMLVSAPYSIVGHRSVSVSAARHLPFETPLCQIRMMEGPSCVGLDFSRTPLPEAAGTAPSMRQEDRVDPDGSLWSFLCSAMTGDVLSLGRMTTIAAPTSL